jgi:hypothetical protein
MKIVAIMGSYRKGKTIGRLVDGAIESVKNADHEAEIEKFTLIDRNITYCRNCGVCRKDNPTKPIARCAIDDDMQDILALLREADAYIFGVPIFEGNRERSEQDVLGAHLLDAGETRALAGSGMPRAALLGAKTRCRDHEFGNHCPPAAPFLR